MDIFSAGVVFASVLRVYVRTLYPTVAGGDSGELVSALCVNAVVHPPGYPLWTIVNSWWVYGIRTTAQLLGMPTPSVAYLANLLNAILSAAASAVLCVAVRLYVKGMTASQSLELSNSSSHNAIDSPASIDTPTPQPIIQSTVDSEQISSRVSTSSNKTVKRRKKRAEIRTSEHTNSEVIDSFPETERSSNEDLSNQDFETVSDDHILAGMFSAAMFAFSPQIWHYSTQAEVFALNNLLCASIFGLSAAYTQASVNKLLLACMQAFVCALALTNQHTSVVYVIPVALYTLAMGNKEVVSLFGIMCMSLCALAGLSLYLNLFLLSLSQPLDSWGDQRTLEGFLIHFLRVEYGTFQLANEVGEEQNIKTILRRLTTFAQWFDMHTMHTGWPLLLVGGLAVTHTSEGILLILCYTLYVLFINSLANLTASDLHVHVTSRMWQQAHIAGYILMGCGVSAIERFLTKMLISQKARSYLPFCWGLILFATCATLCSKHYSSMDESENYTFYQLGKAIVYPLPHKSLLFANDDSNCNSIQYYLRCESDRTDVDFIRLELLSYNWFKIIQKKNFPNIIFPGNRHHPREEGSFSMKQFLDVNFKNKWGGVSGPFVAGAWKYGDVSQDVYQRLPLGYVDVLLPPGAEHVNMKTYFAQSIQHSPFHTMNMSFFNFARPQVYNGSWEEVVMFKTHSCLWKTMQYLAEHGAGEAESTTRTNALMLAYSLTLGLEQLQTHNHKLEDMTNPEVWRNAGIVSGLLAKEAYEGGNKWARDVKRRLGSAILPKMRLSEEELTRRMFLFWGRFIHSSAAQERKDEIYIFVREKLNPWTNKIYSFEFLEDYID